MLTCAEATLWSNGIAVDISADGMDTFGWDINDSGQVVGFAAPHIYPYNEQAFVWQNGTMTWLDGLGGSVTEAFGINSSGWIVGRAKGLDGNYYAVEWEPVPEPSSIALLSLGVLWASILRRKRLWS